MACPLTKDDTRRAVLVKGTLAPVGPTTRRWLAVLALVAAAAAARGPLVRATFALPVSNDDAILLLMGRHVLGGELATTLWNQPYNGALDAYLLAPLLAVLPHHLAYRLYEALGATLLVVLVGLLARRLGGPGAGWAGALLAAWGTPYMALMTATGPPPNFLMPLVTGFPLVVALAALPAVGGRSVGLGAALGLGLVCGLAVWNSSLAIPAFAGMAAGLALAGLRPRLRASLAFAAGLALGASPLLVARAIGASGAKVVTASSAVGAVRPRWLWGQGVLDLGHALRGLAGLQVPLVVDGKERADLPVAVALLLAAGLLVAVAAGCRSRRALPLLGWAAALAGAFWLSRRTGPDELRYLYGLNAPVLALAGAGLAALWAWRRPVALAAGLALLLPWGYGQRVQAERWRDPVHAERVWEVPGLQPAVDALRAAGARSAYASLQFAGRLTLETGGGVIASQAWNERIPGDPLRFRDEVDLDPAPAWVLSTRFSRGHAARRRLPRPRARDGRLVRGDGGRRVRRVPRLPPALRRGAAGAGRADPARDDGRHADRPRRPRPRSRDRVDGGRGPRAGERRRGPRGARAAALGPRPPARPRGVAAGGPVGRLDPAERSWRRGRAARASSG